VSGIRPIVLVLVAVTLSAVGAEPVQAAVKSELDRRSEVRFTLEGKRLTVTTVDLPNVQQNPSTHGSLLGHRIDAVCGTRFQSSRKTRVVDARWWPKGATAMTFHFDRDISRRARWCVIESRGKDGGGDLAYVSFLRAGPKRPLDTGRSPSGEQWRLVTWRSAELGPCVRLGFPRAGGIGSCFNEFAEIEAELG
jgi:ribosomal protein L32